MRPAPTLVKSWDVSVSVGVSKRSWQIEIVQDHLEEAEEMFEVLLVSPEGTVISSINKAQVTIRGSGRGKNKPLLKILLDTLHHCILSLFMWLPKKDI